MARKVYFGNKNKQTWIDAPQSGMTASSAGWSSEEMLLDGRVSIKRSKGSHRRFEMSWLGSMNDTTTQDSLHTIKDFADGIYGNGPYFWLDPFAVDQNLFAPHWATPSLGNQGWPELAPELTAGYYASSVSNNYPSSYVGYVTPDNFVSANKFVIPIPVDYTLNFGWHGPSGGATSGIRIVPYLRTDGTAATAINPTMITAGGTIRTNTKIKGDTYSYVEIFVATTSASELAITGMIAQVLPESDSVASGGFISGRGTTGIEFATSPEIEYYSAAINNGQIGMSATLVEV
jgi:hypothetical protein